YRYIYWNYFNNFSTITTIKQSRRGAAMKKLFNFKTIRTKMIFSFIAVLLLVVALSIYNLTILKSVNKTTKSVLDKALPALIIDKHLVTSIYTRMGNALAFVLTSDKKYEDLFYEESDEVHKTQKKLKNIVQTTETEEVIDNTME